MFLVLHLLKVTELIPFLLVFVILFLSFNLIYIIIFLWTRDPRREKRKWKEEMRWDGGKDWLGSRLKVTDEEKEEITRKEKGKSWKGGKGEWKSRYVNLTNCKEQEKEMRKTRGNRICLWKYLSRVGKSKWVGGRDEMERRKRETINK